METNNYKQLISNMKNNFIAKSKVSGVDMNEGSIIMTIFEAVANIVEQAYIDTRLGFQSNLMEIASSIFDFKKKNGTAANVEVFFSRGVVMDNDVVIPIGTVVSDGTHKFTITQTATIKPNELNSNVVSAQAQNIGIEYNVAPNSITTVESNVSSQVVAVTNAKKAVGGTNEETYTEMLARFKDYINGLQGTNKYGIKAGLLAHEKVRSVSVIEKHVDETGADVVCYVDDGTGNLSDELKAELENLVNGTDESTNPGLRACGIKVDIERCTQVPVDVAATITLYRVEQATADFSLKSTIEKTINDLKVNESVIYADIITALKNTGSYVKNIKNLKLNNIENDVPISNNQIARLGTVNFIYTYQE